MNQDEAVECWMKLRHAVEDVKTAVRLLETAKTGPRTTLDMVLELLVRCELDWQAKLKQRSYDREFTL